VLAVYLGGSGKPNPTTTPSRSPSTSAGPAATGLAKLFLSGAMPTPSRVLVQTEQGQYAIADLATGTLGTNLTSTGRDGAIGRASNGDLVCLCTTEDTVAFDQPTHVRVELVRFGADLRVASRTTILDMT